MGIIILEINKKWEFNNDLKYQLKIVLILNVIVFVTNHML